MVVFVCGGPLLAIALPANTQNTSHGDDDNDEWLWQFLWLVHLFFFLFLGSTNQCKKSTDQPKLNFKLTSSMILVGMFHSLEVHSIPDYMSVKFEKSRSSICAFLRM